MATLQECIDLYHDAQAAKRAAAPRLAVAVRSYTQTERWMAALAQRPLRSAESRMRQAATKLGIPYAAYRANVEAGLKWCSRCKRWQARDEFGPHKRYGLDTSCLESSRAAAREWQRRKRAAWKRERSA